MKRKSTDEIEKEKPKVRKSALPSADPARKIETHQNYKQTMKRKSTDEVGDPKPMSLRLGLPSANKNKVKAPTKSTAVPESKANNGLRHGSDQIIAAAMAARDTKRFNYEPAARHYDIDENYDDDEDEDDGEGEVQGDDGKAIDRDLAKEEAKKTPEFDQVTDDAE